MAISPISYIDYNLRIIRDAITEHLKSIERVEVYLDLGCGSSALTEFIAKIVKTRNIYCVDIDDNAVSIAKSKGISAYRLDLNIDKIPLHDESVDMVTAFEIIEHLWNKDNMLEEAHRVLRPKGLLIISTPNMLAWASRLLMLMGKPPLEYEVSLKYHVQRSNYGHVSLYTPKLLIDHLKAVGFKPKIVKGLITHWAFKNKVVEVVTKALSVIRPTLAPDLLVVATKD